MNYFSNTSIFYTYLNVLNATFDGGGSSAIKEFVQNLLKFDWKTLVAHLVSSLFILICVVYWFWKPTNAFVEKNKNQLNKTFKDLAVANRESQRYLKILKQENINMATIKETTIAQVKKDAENIILKAKETAKTESEIVLENAIAKAKALEETAHIVIRNSVVQLSIDLTKKLVGDNINEKSAEKIIDTYISDIESKSVTDEYKH